MVLSIQNQYKVLIHRRAGRLRRTTAPTCSCVFVCVVLSKRRRKKNQQQVPSCGYHNLVPRQGIQPSLPAETTASLPRFSPRSSMVGWGSSRKEKKETALTVVKDTDNSQEQGEEKKKPDGPTDEELAEMFELKRVCPTRKAPP